MTSRVRGISLAAMLALLLILGTIFWQHPISYAQAAPQISHPLDSNGHTLVGHFYVQAKVARPVVAATVGGNFPWQTADSSDKMVTLHYYNQPSSYVSGVLDVINKALTVRIPNNLGMTLKSHVDVYVYPNRTDFLSGTGVSSTENVGAFTVRDQSGALTIFSPVPNVSSIYLTEVIPHELTHAVFHSNNDASVTQGKLPFVPHWLDEGLAMRTEDDTSQDVTDLNALVSKAVANNTLTNLLTDFTGTYPTNANVDDLDYGEARSFIVFLAKSAGDDNFHGFLNSIQNGDLDVQAFRYFHTNLATMQNRWLTSLGVKVDKNTGYVPVQTTAVPFTQGTSPSITTASHAFPLASGQTQLIHNCIVAGVGVLLISLGLLLDGLWMRRRQKAADAANHTMDAQPQVAPVIAAQTAPGMTDTSATLSATAPFMQDRMPGESHTQPTVPIVPPSAPYSESTSPFVPPPAPFGQSFEASATPSAVFAPVPALPVVALNRFESTFLAIAAIIIFGAGWLTTYAEPHHEWRTGVIVGMALSGVLGLVWLVRGIIFTVQNKLPRISYFLASVAGIAAVITLLVQLPGTVQLQASGYEAATAYRLALQTYQNGGAPKQDQARILTEWGTSDTTSTDFSSATTHLRQAIALDPRNQDARDQLVMATEQWGTSLIGAHQFTDATKILTGEISDASCNSSCKTSLNEYAAKAYLAWGDDLLATNQADQAITEYTTATTTYTGTQAALTAQKALNEVKGLAEFNKALDAAKSGDFATMTQLFQEVASKYGTASIADVAAHAPVPVSGTLTNSKGTSLKGNRLYFFGFNTFSDAHDADLGTYQTTTAVTLGDGGQFSVLLPPNYYYVMIWEDPSVPGDKYDPTVHLNNVARSDYGIFRVTPFKTLSLGTLQGF